MNQGMLFWAMLLILTVACSGGTAGATRDLLAQDYRQMTDQELLSYRDRLEDQIVRVERPTGGTSVGVGVGTGPVRIGVSQGVSRGNIADDLRERRIEVLEELRHRSLQP